MEHATIAREVLAALDRRAQMPPLTDRLERFDVASAYRVAREIRALRVARGERPLGRKIGFTNRTIWEEYGVYAPIWGDVYDRTVTDLPRGEGRLDVAALVEPRIEPEIVFGLAAAPRAGMDEGELLGCIGWVAHGFEIVQSLFPAWKFAAADTVAAFGLHGALAIGPRHPVGPRIEAWRARLACFEIDLARDGVLVDHGRAANVLDGPLSALRYLVELLARDAQSPPLAAGEIVTTGTLTRAFPVAPGQTWSTVLHGLDLPGLRVRLE